MTSPKDFVFDGLPARVLFGAGSRDRLEAELARLDLHRVLALCTSGQEAEATKVFDRVRPRVAGVFTGAVMHTPVDVTERAMEVVDRLKVDGVVAFGGGSTTGLAKAIALRTNLPQIVLPTTYAGSEQTPILGQTERGVKTTLRDERVRPEVVIYDVELTMTLPALLSGVSGLNAIAHAVEALYSREANPIIDLMAREGIRGLRNALPIIAEAPGDLDARSTALRGAWLCGACLGSVGMSLHHKLCHTLGGLFDLPHAETHAVVLPHALAYNWPSIASVTGDLEDAVGGENAPMRLFSLARKVGAPRGLRDIGMPEAGIDEAADLACSHPYWNPRPIERERIRELVARAWAGDEPTAFPGDAIPLG